MSATQVHTELGHMPHGSGLVPGGDPLVRGGPGTNPEGGIAHELGMLLRGRPSRFDGNVMGSRDIPQRSGSAPPSVEGSIAAMGGLFARHPATSRDGPGSSSLSRSNLGTNAGGNGERGDSMTGLDSEQELLKDPAYLAYYYSHINLNPRLPPPLISWESFRLAQRYQTGALNGGLGDGQMGKLRSLDDTHSKSLFSSQQMLPTHREEREEGEDEDRSSLVQSLGRTLSSDWTKDGLMGLQSGGLGARPKSLVDLIQEDFPRTPSPVYSQRVPSRVGTDEGAEAAIVAEMQLSHLRETMSALSEHPQLGMNGITNINGSGSRSGASTPNPVSGLNMSTASSNAHMAAPVARIPSPSPLSQVNRATSPGIVGERMAGTEGLTFGRSSSMSRVEGGSASELAAALQRLEFNQHDRRKPSSAEQLAEAQQRQQLQQLEQLHQMQAIRAEEQHRAQEQEHQARIQREQDQQEQQQRLQQAHQAQQAAAAAAAVGGVPNMYAAAAAMYNQALAGNAYYQNMVYAPQYAAMGLNYPISPALLNPMVAAGYHPSGMQMGYDNTSTGGLRPANGAGQGVGMGNPPGGMGMHSVYKYGAGAGSGMAPPQTPMGADPLYFQYLQQRSAEEARLVAGDPSGGMRGYAVGGHVDILDLQKGGMSPIYGSPEQRSPYTRSSPVGVPMSQKQQANSPSSMSPIMSPGYYGSSPPGLVIPYPQGIVGSPVMAPTGPLSPLSMAVAGSGVNAAMASGGIRRDERGLRVPSGAGMYGADKGARSAAGGGGNYAAGWQGARDGPAAAVEDSRGSSLLEEFKSNKTRRFELSDIVGHVVEFSADQHGSRFIQQKLETATLEEKAMVFDEVIPRAITLMTDVFGNYVIQKFFEHGTPAQRRELASQLVGHVLALSLQMYGCRVIQKALEVVDPEMQGILVSELDGHVMRCVRDQNGNHVVQKCIECVPAPRIQFIVSSFHNQVVALSTHPYGCRVIQRVLEHCSDDQKQRGIMDEILRSTCTLAQDQYGNYVVQHVLEHGNAAERGEIIRKLAGNIVQMSQHKFASNVVEKCLEFGSAADRQILISEMLGVTEENEPLQAMMKDQFANYVVQKVLETCDEQQRAMLLDRIKVHLHALKKYTYGKHIVARVEKLVAAGGKMQARDQAAAARREREHSDRDSPREILI